MTVGPLAEAGHEKWTRNGFEIPRRGEHVYWNSFFFFTTTSCIWNLESYMSDYRFSQTWSRSKTIDNLGTSGKRRKHLNTHFTTTKAVIAYELPQVGKKFGKSSNVILTIWARRLNISTDWETHKIRHSYETENNANWKPTENHKLTPKVKKPLPTTRYMIWTTSTKHFLTSDRHKN